jgi:hypothetical protein
MITTKYFVGLDLGQTNDFSALCVVERIDQLHREPTDQGPLSPMGRSVVVSVKQHFHGSELVEKVPKETRTHSYKCRHLERFPIGTKYPAIVEKVVRLFETPQLRSGTDGKRSTLVVDRTGVGRPVVNMFEERVRLPRLKGEGDWTHVNGKKVLKDWAKDPETGEEYRWGKLDAVLRPVTITGGNAIVPDDLGWHVPKKELVGVLQMLLTSRRLLVAKNLPDAAVLSKELENFRAKVKLNSMNESYEAWREGDHDDLVLSVAIACWIAECGQKHFWMK